MPQEKTRKKNEDIPIIKPENCPGELIKYMNRQRAADQLAMRKIIQEELEPVQKFAKTATDNRSFIQLMALFMLLSLIAGCLYIGTV